MGPHYKWPDTWITGVISPYLLGVITPLITGRGPPCEVVSKISKIPSFTGQPVVNFGAGSNRELYTFCQVSRTHLREPLSFVIFLRGGGVVQWGDYIIYFPTFVLAHDGFSVPVLSPVSGSLTCEICKVVRETDQF